MLHCIIEPKRESRVRSFICEQGLEFMDFSFENMVFTAEDAVETPAPVKCRAIDRIALIGNFLPRRCGIATFTTDIQRAFATRYPEIEIDVWAMNDAGHSYDYPPEVTGSIDAADPQSYREAAREIAARDPDLLWVQHEFGIFGGSGGDHVLHLLDRVTCPVAVTLHTILSEPDADQRRVMDALVGRAQQLIVMADEGKTILVETYAADPARIAVIPHGIPDRPFAPTAPMKTRFGMAGRDVILTFGLLSPGKGIETMIAAMPEIVAHVPDALYVVLGATHPHLIAQEGEAYRDRLAAQAKELGVGDHVRFIDAFVETEELLDYIEAADVYVTPYLNPAQITSGTLSYAVGLGKPVVTTPYVHARELLAGGHGRLVDFGDSAGFAKAIASLLADPMAMASLRGRTYALGRTMIWPRFAESSLTRFAAIPVQKTALLPIRSPGIPKTLPMNAIERLSDATGMAQHSVFSIVDRAHGYCVDDNARALILMCRKRDGSLSARASWARIFAGFVQHAWNPDQRCFRNFMSFERRWLEAEGSCDSNARTLWSLGVAAAEAPDVAVRQWATSLFDQAYEAVAGRASLRTRAFTMLALVAMLEARNEERFRSQIASLGDSLIADLARERRPDWCWFETVLAYDNARLPEALIRAGIALERNDFVVRGLETLTWLGDRQSAKDGHYRAVGSDSFGRTYSDPLPFDQQPLEAWATIDAYAAAWTATRDRHWPQQGERAYRWFLGENDLGVALADPGTGECFDGLMPTGVNRNQGAESVLAFHMATLAINRLMAENTPEKAEGARGVLAEPVSLRHHAHDVVTPPVTAQAPRRPFAGGRAPVSPRLEQPRAV
jgi:glycosyltransferase involved in cell wall biosynthesis